MTVFMLFVFGACLASFLNVAVERKFRFSLKNALSDRSRCESCKRVLRWWELVPVISWLVLGGRCARCRASISWLHPLSELVLGFVCSFGSLYADGDPIRLIPYLIVVLLLYVFAMFDIMHRIVPNKMVLGVGVILLILIGSGMLGQFPYSLTIPARLLGACALSGVFGFINFLTHFGLFIGVEKGRQGFGWGDAKLSICLGLLVGWPLVNVVFWVAVFSGALVGVVVFLRVRKKYFRIPFVPFLVIGCWVAMLWGNGIIEWFGRTMS
jgi:prepilin signal peptidase PulO-like enzyme (type II secretory pathway)